MAISPYAVFRRSRLPVAELAAVGFDDTWHLVEEHRRLEDECARRGAEIADALAEVVGSLPADARGPVIVLRRDVHNGRAARAVERLADPGLAIPPTQAAAITAWADAVGRIAESGDRVRASWDRDRDRSAVRLRELFHHDAIERSVQLSGEQLYRDLRDFADGGTTGLKPAKARVRETSLVNYAYRAAFKPSPFGRFTEIGAFDPADADRAVDAAHDGVRSAASLNRMLVNWVLAALPQVGDGLDVGDLVLSSTVRLRDDTVEYIGVLPGSSRPGELAAERVVRIQADPLLTVVVERLASGPVRGALVVEALLAAGADEPAARALVRGLLRLGFLFFRPAADDHDPAYAAHVLAMIDAATSPEVAVLRDRFAVLLDLERRFADEPAAGRTRLLEQARDAVEGIAALAGTAAPSPDVLKSLVFEDTPAVDPPAAWDLGVVERAEPDLRSLWRLATVLDTVQDRRIALYSFAVRAFGERDRLTFTDFFDRFSSLGAVEQAEVLAGRHSEEVATFRQDRADVIEDIRGAVERTGGVAFLDPGVVDRAVDRVRGLRETESVTFRTQFARLDDRDGPALVVNGVLTGYGVYMSRFGSFVHERGGWSLPAAQRAHLAERFPDQVDLNAVLGFNFNLHPRVCSTVVDYPGARTIGADRVLRPADLDVAIDHGTLSLSLRDRRTDRAVDLVPMNFMTPYGVPLLYRLLEQLAPSNRYHWNPWEDITGATDGPAPRLLVGDVVAERRAWAFPAHAVPELAALSRDDTAALDRLDRWRTEQGLPREAFVVCQTPDERAVLAGRAGEATRRLADFAHIRRASVHKPMYVDFRNPYLVRSLAKSALSRPDIVITVRECLPGSRDYAGAAAAAEEYFVELAAD